MKLRSLHSRLGLDLTTFFSWPVTPSYHFLHVIMINKVRPDHSTPVGKCMSYDNVCPIYIFIYPLSGYAAVVNTCMHIAHFVHLYNNVLERPTGLSPI